MLSISHITKKFDAFTALDDVSLTVEPGTITSIIGPSGSGKTTLLKTIAFLENPDAGSIEIDGAVSQFPLVGAGKKNVWPVVTIMFQQLFIWPHLTLRQNILLPKGGKVLPEDEEYLATLIEMFNMEAFLDRYPNEASLGQKQRTALVRALLLRPKYLLLDEVTASLDTEQASLILSHLSEIKKQGIGILAVAHNIDFAFSLSDKIVFLDKGKIVKEGKPYEFLLETENKKILSFIKGAYVGIPNVRFYTGQEQFQAYHLSLLDRLPAGSTIHIIGGVADTWYGAMGDRFAEYTKKRYANNIVWKMLMYEHGPQEKELVAERPDLNDFYMLPSSVKNTANVNIMSDGTSIIQVFQPQPMVIEIRNEATSQAYLTFYNDLLKSSARYKN